MRTFKKFVIEAIIAPSKEPNTMSLWHGGNIQDTYRETIDHKKGRWEYGPGLYLTTHYGTAVKYAKGSRKLWLVTITKGGDANDVFIPEEKVLTFVNTFVIKSKRKDIVASLDKFKKPAGVPAYIFINSIINNDAIKSIDTGLMREFLVDCGVDYYIVDNAFGWHERMIVLFNMKKLQSKEVVLPKDTIETFDLPTEWVK